ncbi:MAG: S9 family peptidase [Bacteroidales bacterium]|nr:S9 family peptidase [Bacteroidales bacterium]MCF8343126.1 S9 family peptidase [Bacteroidales bacterium]MCF8351264.1 S9 family peptidase [Bacteroidales bacterium]MCF8376094.1 S9 family peptidase [Bacteroidales bacterium]MCF8400373.1 S9 family peptidase [Bacteroidales bacterium]
MKKTLTFAALLIAVLMISCQQQEKTEQAEIIGKPDIQLTSDRMTPEALWSFGRVSDPQVSPDGQKIVYGVTYYSIDQNKGNRELYIMNADGSDIAKITESPKSEYNAVWRPDGQKIGFLYPTETGMQLWEMNPDGSGRTQITEIKHGVTGFKYAPNQQKILYTKEVFIENKFKNLYEGLSDATGRLMDDLMYRHWDEWVDTYSHVFFADYDGSKVWNDVDIMEGEPYQSPLKPFGGIEQIDWSPGSKVIAYTSKKLYGKEATLSTNSDIYLYDTETGQTTNMTEGMMGFDVAPLFSPDGNYLAWESMEREGYESDQNRLFIINLNTHEETYASKGFDQNVGSLSWTADSKNIYFTSDWHGAFNVYKYSLESDVINQVTKGLHDIRTVTAAGDQLIATKQTMKMPTEIYSINPENGELTQMTFTNDWLLEQLKMGDVEERWMTTHDNKNMQVFVIYPPDFDPEKKYPTLLYCKGGPQGPLSQSFHFRWNYQIMAANDYIIVAPARRGVSGFGQAWQEQISGDYHGKSMQDYLTAIDNMSRESFVNEDRLGAIGASAGGYAVFYLAGNHDGRFKAFIAHDGIFNEEAQYLETEELWFENWDKGGPFWDEDNEVVEEVYAHSPHRFVQYWDTPILVIHGEKDYRVVFTQGMTAFNAAVLRDVPAQFLYFPDENHWVLRPQNGILWQRVFFNWLDKWLK